MEGDPCSSDSDCFYSGSASGTNFECQSGMCEAEPECVGTVIPCAALDLVRGVETRGCDWVSASRTCMGVAEACSLQSDITCDFQAGCRFE